LNPSDKSIEFRRIKVSQEEIIFKRTLIEGYNALPEEYKIYGEEPSSASVHEILDAIERYIATLASPYGEYKDGLLQRLLSRNQDLGIETLQGIIKDSIQVLSGVYSQLSSLSKLSDEELKKEFEDAEDELKIIAICYEVLRRVSSKEAEQARERGATKIPPVIKLHPEQILAAYFGSPGRSHIIDFKTGEGKTEVEFVISVLAKKAYGLLPLCVTHNEPLKVQTQDRLRKYYDFLGLKVGDIVKDTTGRFNIEDILSSDVIWTEWAEPVYLWLEGVRTADSKVYDLFKKAYWVIDEADSVLIEQAASPCVISASSGRKMDRRQQEVLIAAARAVNTGEIVDFGSAISWARENARRFRRVVDAETLGEIALRALQAQGLRRDIDYFIKSDGSGIVLIEHLSGAPAATKQFMGGLHQAVEAKEIVEGRLKPGSISEEGITWGAYTLYSLIRRSAGFTALSGTAKIWAETFDSVWGKRVIAISPHHSSGRIDYEIICRDRASQLQIVKKLMEEADEEGRPVAFVFKDMERMENFRQDMEAIGIDGDRLRYLTPRELLELSPEKLEALKEMVGEEGALTFATMVFGRGWDVRASKPLRVIIIDYHPEYVREQARGRTGRMGSEGDAFWIYLNEEIGDIIKFPGDYTYIIRSKSAEGEFTSWSWGQLADRIEGVRQVDDDSIATGIDLAVQRKDSEALQEGENRLKGTILQYKYNDMAINAIYGMFQKLSSPEGFVELLDHIAMVARDDTERALISQIKGYVQRNKDDGNFRELILYAPLVPFIEKSAQLDIWREVFPRPYPDDIAFVIIVQEIERYLIDFWMTNKRVIETYMRER
jgi:hypothetical protein